ncbi:MAG: response regulator [Alphaproteobacteria bacterium]
MTQNKRPLVLVIDDDAMVRDTISDILIEADYDVILAPNGEAGLYMFDERNPGLVITDMIMPEKEGVETIVELRRKNPNIPIIAISGGGRSGHLDFLKIAKIYGATTVLSKPLDMDDLAGAVRKFLPNT